MKQNEQFSVDDILAEFGTGANGSAQNAVDVDALLNDILHDGKTEPTPRVEEKSDKTVIPPIKTLEPIDETPTQTVEVPTMTAEVPSDAPIEQEKTRVEMRYFDSDEQPAADSTAEDRAAVPIEEQAEAIPQSVQQTVESDTPPMRRAHKPKSEAVASMPDDSAEETAARVKQNSRRSNRTTTLMVLLTLLAVVVEGLNRFPNYTPLFLSRAEMPLSYCGISLALLLLAMLVSYRTMLSGLGSLFTFKANKNAPAAISALACAVQGVILLFLPDVFANPNIHLYSSIAVACLLFAACGNKALATVARNSLKVISSKYRKCGMQVMDEEKAMPYVKGLLNEYPTLLYNKQTNGVSHFDAHVNAPDQADAVSRVLAPLLLGVAILLGAAVGVTVGDFSIALTVFAAVSAICAPFSYILAAAMPQKKRSSTLLRLGAAVLGAGDAEESSYTNAVVLEAAELFPEDTVTLYGIKTFGSARIDDAILDAASVACAGNSILADTFMQIVSGERSLLRPAQNISFEDGLGLSAWVQNKRVLIGTRELLLNYGVDVPSKDYETRYIDAGNELVYLSTAGELAAVFVIGLNAAPEVTHALRMLEYRDVSVIVNTSDALITIEKLERLFDINREMLKLLPARLQPDYAEASAPTDTVDATIINNGTVYSIAASVCEAKKLKSRMMLTMILQLAAALTGLVIIAVFAFVRDFTQLTPYMLFVYQLMWLILSLLVA